MSRLLSLLAAAVAVALGTVVLSAAASAWAEGWPPLPASVSVGLGALALALGVPLALARALVGFARGRGSEVSALSIAAGAAVGLNALWLAGVQLAGPTPLDRLLAERGTWLVDALTGRGPFGPAAVPWVERAAAAARAERRPDAVADVACDRTARALAMGILGELGSSEAVARILGRHGIEEGAALDAIPAGVGRALLADALDLASATAPLAELPELPPADLASAGVERTRIRLVAPGWEGLHEEGAWRVCLGEDGAALERGRELVRVGRASLRAAEPAPPAPPSWEPAVREALRSAVRGRTGFALGLPPDEGWAEALTPASAVAQARRILAWCAPAAAVDPAHAGRLDLIRQRWSVDDPSPDATARLELDGRGLLREVTLTCGPVARDHVAAELARGFPASAADRSRWLALELESLDRSALAEVSPVEVRAEVPGGTVRVVADGAVWRVDWR